MVGWNFELREICLRDGSDRSNDMRATDINDVGIALNTIGHMVKMDHVSYLVFGKQVLKFIHGHCIVRSVVESKVADLKWRLTSEPKGVRE